jgi:histidinol dehydrogenase
MLCTVAGSAPPADETDAWLSLALACAQDGRIRKFQIYGKARPSPNDPLCDALPVEALEERARLLREKLRAVGLETPVAVYP